MKRDGELWSDTWPWCAFRFVWFRRYFLRADTIMKLIKAHGREACLTKNKAANELRRKPKTRCSSIKTAIWNFHFLSILVAPVAKNGMSTTACLQDGDMKWTCRTCLQEQLLFSGCEISSFITKKLFLSNDLSDPDELQSNTVTVVKNNYSDWIKIFSLMVLSASVGHIEASDCFIITKKFFVAF